MEGALTSVVNVYAEHRVFSLKYFHFAIHILKQFSDVTELSFR